MQKILYKLKRCQINDGIQTFSFKPPLAGQGFAIRAHVDREKIRSSKATFC